MDHRAAARGKNQFRLLMVHQLVDGVHCGRRDAADGAFRTAGGISRLRDQLRGSARAVHRVVMRRKHDGTSGFQSDHRFIDYGGGRVCGRNNSRDHTDGHTHIPDTLRAILPQNPHRFHVANRFIHAAGGEKIFCCCR